MTAIIVILEIAVTIIALCGIWTTLAVIKLRGHTHQLTPAEIQRVGRLLDDIEAANAHPHPNH